MARFHRWGVHIGYAPVMTLMQTCLRICMMT